jgi:ABC-type bacteriocin/lantibiotic exporter with double-glycine peptidase domain
MARGLLTLNSGLRLGDLVAFMQYAGLFHHPIQQMVGEIHRANPHKCPQNGCRACSMRRSRSGRARRALRNTRRIGEIAFDRTSFACAGRSVLADFNLRIRTGECVALSARQAAARAPSRNCFAGFTN